MIGKLTIRRQTSLPAILALFFALAHCLPVAAEQSTAGRIVEAAGVKPGMIVGEAGAGTGGYTFPLAERGGESGRIYANDIDTGALAELERRCEQTQVTNITTVAGEIADPLFPVGDLDMIFMRYVFHHLEDPVAWMKNVIPSMKPDAPMVIVERDTNKTKTGRDHFMSEEEVLEIMAKTDFVLDRIDYSFGVDNIYFFRLKR